MRAHARPQGAERSIVGSRKQLQGYLFAGDFARRTGIIVHALRPMSVWRAVVICSAAPKLASRDRVRQFVIQRSLRYFHLSWAR